MRLLTPGPRSAVLARALATAALLVGAVLGAAPTGAQEGGIDFESCGIAGPAAVAPQGGEVLFCELTVEKTLESGNPEDIGGTVTFEVRIENTGNVSLFSVGLADFFDDFFLEFDSATPAPDFGPEDGIMVWDQLDESGGDDVWDPGDFVVVTVRFEALEVADDGDAENCAIAFASPLLKTLSITGVQEDPIFESNEECASVDIVEGEPDEPDETERPPELPTPTEEPELTEPTPAATVSPPATPTQPSGDIAPDITAPDTGGGPGGGAGAGTWILAGIALAAVAVSGAGISFGKRGA